MNGCVGAPWQGHVEGAGMGTAMASAGVVVMTQILAAKSGYAWSAWSAMSEREDDRRTQPVE